MKTFFAKWVFPAAVFAFAAGVRLTVAAEDDVARNASEKAEFWMRCNKLQLGLDKKKGSITEIQASEFDIPRNASKSSSLKSRDEAFDDAFCDALAKQLNSLRRRFEHDEERIDGTKGGKEIGVSLRELFEEEINLCKAYPDGEFVYKSFSVSDDEGEDVDLAHAARINVSSCVNSSSDGGIKGVGLVKAFESFDTGNRLYGVAVVSSFNPATATDIVRAMETGKLSATKKSKRSFDDWLQTRDFDELLGVLHYVDGDGKLWVVGVAYSDVPDDKAARRMARKRAAFAFGANIKTRKRLVETTDHKTYYCQSKVFDATDSVTGSSYPDDMVEYRVVQRNSPIFGGEVYATLCIMRSGTKEFRERQFENNLRTEVGSKFYEGKRQSLLELRGAIMTKMNALGKSDKDKYRRKRLLEVIEKLDTQIKELDAQFDFSTQ